jgi:uncharacterized membrane protein YbaN (DUF454 family)
MKKSVQQTLNSRTRKQEIVRIFLLVAGTFFLVLGALGIVLPILPTTPFLLLSAACYLRSSDRMHHWLLNNRWFGKFISNYQEGKGIPLKTKVLAMIVLWVAILFSAFIAFDEILIAQIALLAVALGVSIHLVRLPNLKR